MPPRHPPSPPRSSHHFQSADALSAVQLPDGGGILAATFGAEGLAAWLLPAAGSLQALGTAAQVRGLRECGYPQRAFCNRQR